VQSAPFNGAPTHADCRAGVEEAAKLCSQLGHEVSEARFEIDAAAMARATGTIMSANLLSTLEDRASALGRELVEDDVEPITWTLVQRARATSSADYARAVRHIHGIGRRVEGFLRDYDVILTPTMATPPPELGVLSLSNPDLASYGQTVVQTVGFTQLFNASGHPAMSVPLHWNADGLPIGIQFAGRFGDEATLFRLAGQLETERPWFEHTAR
jgi:Asp-tRNA(Asn)/Glu-tRNA(Gln) amidotransferase A subunit family amidase